LKKKSLVIRDEIIKILNSYKVLRWTELFEMINVLRKESGEPSLGKATLTSHLKDLVKEGIVTRIVDESTYPPAVYYKLIKKIDENIPNEIFKLWQEGNLKPYGNPWSEHFFLFSRNLHFEKLPKYPVHHWLHNLFAEFYALIRNARRDEIQKTLSKKILDEARYYWKNQKYALHLEKRKKNHGVLSEADKAKEVQEKMYEIALKHLFSPEYLDKSEGEVTSLSLISDLYQTFLKLHDITMENIMRNNTIDLKFKPNPKDPYFLIWLANKKNPTLFENFALLPQEQRELEYLQKKLTKTKPSFEKVMSFVKQPIDVLIIARIPLDWID